jgi:hypothetical protein
MPSAGHAWQQGQVLSGEGREVLAAIRICPLAVTKKTPHGHHKA